MMWVHRKLRDITGGVDDDLLERGRAAWATVTNLAVVGPAVSIAGQWHRVCDVDLHVVVDDESGYSTRVRQRVPVRFLATLPGGARTVAVRIDPSDRNRVAIALGTDTGGSDGCQPGDGDACL